MNARAEAFAAAAEALAGTPFRLHGRDPASGLDCVGLVEAALAAAGLATAPLPCGYALRNTAIAPHLACAPALGLVPASGPPIRGDVLLCRPGAAQHHLVIVTAPGRWLHAHAGLGRIVRQGADPAWPVVRHWRLSRDFRKDD